METSAVEHKTIGLAYWMQQVHENVDKVSDGFKADTVHDLRTALRRCRSMADGLMVFDSDPAWKKMKKAGKQLFQSLGTLRDTHVLAEWIEKLAPSGDQAAQNFIDILQQRELEQQRIAVAALEQFDRTRWSRWAQELPSRAARIPLGDPVFAGLALERWYGARALHRRALRNRTNVSFHELRIGIKRLRYTVENFLPGLHELWGGDLKQLQDALGDVHDLDVLWHTALDLRVFADAAARELWRTLVQQERDLCLERYRQKMVGRDSLWPVWRTALPQDEQFRALGFQRLKIWASFLDPDVSHSKHVARLALRLFDGLSDRIRPSRRESCRYILQAAALMHDVGHARAEKSHHKASARLIRKLTPPPGWTADEVRTSALVARYHRGALPSEAQKTFSALAKSKQWLVQFLGGILRLACACDQRHDALIRRVEVESSDPVLTVRAEGYVEATPLAEHLAGARHLLEIAYHRPVFILPYKSPAA